MKNKKEKGNFVWTKIKRQMINKFVSVIILIKTDLQAHIFNPDFNLILKKKKKPNVKAVRRWTVCIKKTLK